MVLLSKLAHRSLVTVLAVVIVVAQLMAMGPAETALGRVQPTSVSVVGMGALDSVLAALGALALVWGTNGRRGAHALAVCLAAWGYVMAYSAVVALLQPSADGLARTLFEAHFPLVEALGLAGAIRFSALFPSRVLPADTAPPESVPLGLRSLQRLRRAVLGPVAPWVAAVLSVVLLLTVNRVTGGILQEAPLNPFAATIRFAAFTAVVLNLRISWIRVRGADREQMLWAMVGLTLLLGCLGILIGGNVLLAVTGWRIPLVNWRPVVLDLSLLGLLWGTVMGVLYGGALTPARIGRTVVLLSCAVTSALFLAAGLEALFSDVLMARLALPPGLGTALAVALTALAFTRARGSMEAPLDHLWSVEPVATTD